MIMTPKEKKKIPNRALMKMTSFLWESSLLRKIKVLKQEK